jgi:hypothetical protein
MTDERPKGNNADEWHLFLSERLDSRATSPNGLLFVAVQIAEAIDDAERRGTTPSPDVSVREALKKALEYIKLHGHHSRSWFNDPDAWNIVHKVIEPALSTLPQPGAAVKCRQCNGTGTVELTIAEQNTISEMEVRYALERAHKYPTLDPATAEACAKVADQVQACMHEECDFGAGIAAKAIRAIAGKDAS